MYPLDIPEHETVVREIFNNTSQITDDCPIDFDVSMGRKLDQNLYVIRFAKHKKITKKNL